MTQFNFSVTSNFDTAAVKEKIEKAAHDALKDVIVAVAKQAIEDSPVSGMWPSIAKDVVMVSSRKTKSSRMVPRRKPTGNNKRSIYYAIGDQVDLRPPGVEDGENGGGGGELSLNNLQGAVYSTSGYGGYLCTGTVKTPARPYMYPAAEERFTVGEMEARIKEKLGE